MAEELNEKYGVVPDIITNRHALKIYEDALHEGVPPLLCAQRVLTWANIQSDTSDVNVNTLSVKLYRLRQKKTKVVKSRSQKQMDDFFAAAFTFPQSKPPVSIQSSSSLMQPPSTLPESTLTSLSSGLPSSVTPISDPSLPLLSTTESSQASSIPASDISVPVTVSSGLPSSVTPISDPSLPLPSTTESLQASLIPPSLISVPVTQSTQTATLASARLPNSPQKICNSLSADITRKEHYLTRLGNSISIAKNQLEQLDKDRKYFKRKNVLSREAAAKKQIKSLREKNASLKRSLKSCNMKIDKLNSEKSDNVKAVVKENESTSKQVRKERNLKSYYKCMVSSKKQQVRDLKKTIKTLKKEKAGLEKAMLKFTTAEYGETGEGAFSDDMRLCVYDLLGLEVGIEKVAPVIAAVASRLFNTDIALADLPSRQTVLRMADEAHYLVKKYYAQRLESQQHFGIKKDGTSRQKVNILDTSITLPSGEVLPQGFKTVARETAQAITDTTREQLEEICTAGSKDSSWKAKLLSKLSFLMTDRAANEKLSNRQIAEWVKAELQAAGMDPDTSTVHPMYCMVHVLLGFHREVVQATSEAQKQFEVEGGKLGRDSGELFIKWRFENIATRIVRNVSDLLGPNGDERCGIRSKWLADCRMRNIKSLIGDYRDNRFNGVFEGAAQILHHVDDILALEKRLPSDINLRVKSVMFDLKDSRAVTILQAFAIFYIKITEPFRQLMVSSSVSYLELSSDIQPMFASLRQVEAQPELLLDETFLFGRLKQLPQEHPLCLSAAAVRHPDRYDLLLCMVSKMAGACIKIFNLQLADFLPGGELSTPPSEEVVARVKGSGADNLASERHFGSLDSSMKRRRHATLHHHSTILMLKSQRKNLISWLARMTPSERAKQLKVARKEGKLLRQKHQEEVKAEQTKEEMLLQEEERKKAAKASKGGSKKRVGESLDQTSSKRHKGALPPSLNLPAADEIKRGQWVAVAYDNGWYPGTVMEVDEETVQVEFMHPTMIDGQYSWPKKRDLDILDKKYIFRIIKDHPSPVSGGRLFTFPKEEFETAQKDFITYKKLYFL